MHVDFPPNICCYFLFGKDRERYECVLFVCQKEIKKESFSINLNGKRKKIESAKTMKKEMRIKMPGPDTVKHFRSIPRYGFTGSLRLRLVA